MLSDKKSRNQGCQNQKSYYSFPVGTVLSIVGWVGAGVSLLVSPSLPMLYLFLGLGVGTGYAFPNMIPMAVLPLFFDRFVKLLILEFYLV